MATSYPGALDTSFSTHADAGDAILAIQNELGVDPSGSAFSTVAALLANRARVVAESHADTTIVNTTTETDAVSLTLPAGSVAAGDRVRLTVQADTLNNSGASVNYRFRFKFGATTILDTGAGTITYTANASRAKAVITADIVIESTTAQRIAAAFTGQRSAASWANGSLIGPYVGYGTAAEDTATSKAVTLTVQMSAANALADFVVHAASLEIIKKV